MKNPRLSKNRFGKCNVYYFTDEKITGLATTYSLPLDWPDVFLKKLPILQRPAYKNPIRFVKSI